MAIPAKRWEALRARLAMVVPLVGLMAVLLFLDARYRTDIGVNLIALAATILGLYEFYCLMDQAGIPSRAAVGILYGVGYLLGHWVWMHAGSGLPRESSVLLLDTLLVGAVLAMFLIEIAHGPDTTTVSRIAVTLLGVVYIAFLISFCLKLVYLRTPAGGDGHVYLALMIAVAKGGDSGAYFVGSRFGRIKLLPRISPNKTLEGLFGGLAASVLVAIGIVMNTSLHPLGLARAALFGLVVGLSSQLGDFCESLIKRWSRAKDSGRIFPGYGGVLDVIDSLLVAGPVAYLMLRFFGIAPGGWGD
ncbi:MAG: phosphatidate cytidylyltransferase [Planctomycetota bacterium]